jgi:hypothetical protein
MPRERPVFPQNAPLASKNFSNLDNNFSFSNYSFILFSFCKKFSKIYYSENAYANHLQSNKHKAAEAKTSSEGNSLIT